MHAIMKFVLDAAADTLRSRAELQFEILALRQQLVILKREKGRPTLVAADRMFWVFLSQIWTGWRDALVIVTPETVIRWHRAAFRLFWTMKSRQKRRGRQPVAREVRDLIRRMSEENTSWGAPRIHGELLKLGITVSQASVSKYMVSHPRPPSQTWQTFLNNHVGSLASIDFFVVPTATFAVLFVFVVLRHERRRIVHFGVTAHPTAAWVAQQFREAFPWDTAPRYLIRDRDGAYGSDVCSTVMAMGIEEVVTAPRSPWQNPFVERVIGSIRRECLDHVIVLNERHLRRILLSCSEYYHGHGLTCRWARTPRTGGPSSRPTAGRSWRFPRLAASIIGTSGWRPDHRPTGGRCWRRRRRRSRRGPVRPLQHLEPLSDRKQVDNTVTPGHHHGSAAVRSAPMQPLTGPPLVRMTKTGGTGEWRRPPGPAPCGTATVLEDGFEYQGRRYKSLSAAARAITGTRWNGPLFFGLRKHGSGK